MLLVDIIALSPEQLAEVRDAAPQFINRVGGDQRRTAVVTVGDRLRIITDFAAGDEFRSARARATTSAFTQTAAGLTAADAQASRQRGLIDAAQFASVTGPKAIIYFATPAQMPTPDQRTTTINPFAGTRGAAARDAPRLHRCQPRLHVVDPQELPR